MFFGLTNALETFNLLMDKIFCKYCKTTNHVIKSCPKLVANEAKKKRFCMTIQDATPSTLESANVVQDSEWAFTMQCNFDSMLSDSCMFVVDLGVWYFDNGATKHITQH